MKRKYSRGKTKRRARKYLKRKSYRKSRRKRKTKQRGGMFRSGPYCICGKSMQVGGTEISEGWKKVLRAVKEGSAACLGRGFYAAGIAWISEQTMRPANLDHLDTRGNSKCSACVGSWGSAEGCANKEWAFAGAWKNQAQLLQLARSAIRESRHSPRRQEAVAGDLVNWMANAAEKAGNSPFKMCERCAGEIDITPRPGMNDNTNTFRRMETEVYWINYMKKKPETLTSLCAELGFSDVQTDELRISEKYPTLSTSRIEI